MLTGRRVLLSQENAFRNQQHADLRLQFDLDASNREWQSRAWSREIQHGDLYGSVSANYYWGSGREGHHFRYGTRRGQSLAAKYGRSVFRSRRLEKNRDRFKNNDNFNINFAESGISKFNKFLKRNFANHIVSKSFLIMSHSLSLSMNTVV